MPHPLRRRRLILDPTDVQGTNMLWLPGFTGNYCTSPIIDAYAAIDGDVQIRAKLWMADYSPDPSFATTYFNIIGKSSEGGALDSAWKLRIENGGWWVLLFFVGAAQYTEQCTVRPPASLNGTVAWIRADLDLDDGAGNHSVTYYYSTDDGKSWVQWDKTTVAGTFASRNVGQNPSSPAPINIGSGAGGGTHLFPGSFLKGQVFDSIGEYPGDPYWEMDFQDLAESDVGPWLESSINANSVTLLQTAGEPNARVVEQSTLTELFIPTADGNDAFLADTAAISTSGDMELRIEMALADLTPAANDYPYAKSGSWYMEVTTAGDWQLVVVTAEGTKTYTNPTKPDVLFSADELVQWRITFDMDNGSSASEVIWQYKQAGFLDDDTGWTTHDSDTDVVVTSVTDSANPIRVGSLAGVAVASGRYRRAMLYDGILGTIVADIDFTGLVPGIQTWTEESAQAGTVVMLGTGAPSAEAIIAPQIPN